jgi:hypothetical protein
MTQPLVDQLRFTRAEWLRALRGVQPADAARRLEPMNSIAWIVGHLAWQEQRYFVTRAQQQTPLPILNKVAASGGPATTPEFEEMRKAWQDVTTAVDPWLDSLTPNDLTAELSPPGPPRSIGDAIQRVTYHYWFHIGEILAIRQLLGHRRLPQFVGALEERAPYRPTAS